MVLEKTLKSPLDCKKIQPVHPKGDQSWVFIGRTDVEAETPILWPPAVKSWLIWKDPDAGKDWGQEEKRTTEDETVGWHHRLDGHGFGWTPGVGDGQGGLACCGSWGCRVGHDWATELNWRNQLFCFIFILFESCAFKCCRNINFNRITMWTTKMIYRFTFTFSGEICSNICQFLSWVVCFLIVYFVI